MVRTCEHSQGDFCIILCEHLQIHYIFHLQRRPIYYITVIVAPTFLISALSILGIFSPGASDGPRNEKVSLGLGSLLAMTVLLGIVAGAMPKSNSIPLLGKKCPPPMHINAIGLVLLDQQSVRFCYKNKQKQRQRH
ncbi:hypothetical protein OESDEN_07346 [Oesophagostomum dentatum]|uniref:Neurotransmitter-gated ion-channel transmembrane domain-containing protein n=1 Tax=Oesophagostomum dentatum TaxID=61180 RepID=A0A0B1TBN8_OESDE|nr:hypothetical protein OESDEN_07346 [Oesophagostomum dentatum]